MKMGISARSVDALGAAALASLAGCGVGTAVGIESLDDGGGSSDTPGAVIAFTVESPEVPDATVRFRLTDEQGDSATVSFFYQPKGEPARLMKELVGTDNPAVLSATQNGFLHAFDWSFPNEDGLPADGGFEKDVLVFALVQGGSQEAVDGANADLVDMGNDGPEILDAPAPGDPEVFGTVVLPFEVADSSGDLVDIQIKFNVQGDQPDMGWKLARPKGTPDEEDTPIFAFTNVVAQPRGTDETFLWDTSYDLQGFEGDVRVRFTAWDRFVWGNPLKTDPFRVDNNEIPIAVIDSVNFGLDPDRRRGIPVPLNVDDAEDDEVLLVFQWAFVDDPFPDLPDDPEEISAILDDPQKRVEFQIASEFPAPVAGRVVPLVLRVLTEQEAAAHHSSSVRLPEVAAGAATLLADGLGGLSGMLGRTLEILRPSTVPERVSARDLHGPVAALPLGEGPTALVLDGSGTGTWRLSEVDLASGALQEIATGAGNPDALTIEHQERSVLVASDTAGLWQVVRVELADGKVTPLIATDGSTDEGPVRAIVSLGTDVALITVGSSLVRLDYHIESGGQLARAPRATTLLGGLTRPWGLAVDPLNTNRVWISEIGPSLSRFPEGEVGRVVSLALDTHRKEAVVLGGLGSGGLGFPRPRWLALERSGARLLVVTDSDPADGTRELRAVHLGRSDLTDVFEIHSELPDDVRSLATGRGGMRILTLPAEDDLMVGGGVAQRRTVVDYDATRQVATVDTPFDPDPEPLDVWRVQGPAPAHGSPEGRRGTFVWDTADVPQGGKVKLRVTPIDADVGVADESGPKDVLAALPGVVETLPGGGAPRDVEMADLDGDGDLDLVTASNDQALRVFFQEKPGKFDPCPMELSDGDLNNPSRVATADLDGDHDLDIVSMNQSDNLGVFLQEPSGEGGSIFVLVQKLGDSGTMNNPIDLELADLNADGRIDIVLTSGLLDPENSRVTAFLQTTPGMFSESPTVLDDSDQALVGGPTPADLDGDGLVDVVRADALQRILGIHSQESPGQFEPGQTLGIPPLGGVHHAVAADLNGDGRLDLISSQWVFFQTSTAGIFPVEPLQIQKTSTESAVDVDGDGDLDLFGWNPGRIFFQTAPGLFDAPPLELEVGITDATAADIDGDGDIDFLLAPQNSDELKIFLQLGPARFDPEPTVLRSPTGFFQVGSLAAADLNADGLLDLLTSNGSELVLFYQKGPGRFKPDPLVLPTGARFVTAADLNGDGHVDIVSTHFVVLEGLHSLKTFHQEAGTFVLSQVLGEGVIEDPRSIVASDLDGDRFLDLVSANRGSDDLTIFRQIDQGEFETAPSVTLNSDMKGPRSVAVADLDGDGDSDLVSANEKSDNLTIFFQIAPGQFDPEPTVLGGRELTEEPTFVTVADLDGDGDLDLVSANQKGNNLTIFFQTAPGEFDPDPTVVGLGFTNRPQSVVATDLDHDGDLDLVSANRVGNDLTAFLQTSPGRFDPSPIRRSGGNDMNGPISIAAVDLDGDGDPDLVSANEISFTLTIFFGDH